MMALLSWLLGSSPAAERLFINYSHVPRAVDLLAYDTCILDLHAEVDLKPGKALGHKFYAYLSLVELAAGSPADDLAKKRSVPVIGANENWGSHVLDISSPAWWEHLLEDGAAVAVERGFDGIFLDTADSAARLPGGAVAHEGRLLDLIHAIHRRWPQQRILINRGFDLLPKLQGVLSGVMVESVFQGFDVATKLYRPNSEADVKWLAAHIKKAQALGLRVYAVDYTPVESLALARETATALRELGCVPLVTTHDLSGIVIAPKAAPKALPKK
jgi:polysaccharide biosynthesis protein PelA